MRKIILLFFAVLLSGMAHAQGAEMVNRANYWRFDYSQDVITFFVTDNKMTVNQHTYYEAGREVMSKGVMAKRRERSGPFVSSRSCRFWLRESEGKVYVRKDDYVSVMRQTYETTGDDLFLEESGDTEVLLYDFTLGVGDRYPCKGDVTVSSVEDLVTRDGIVRRMLRLSNGLTLIEGIGCINSWGDIFGYQNFGPATNSKGVMYNSVLSTFTVYGNIVYKKADEETTPVAGLLSDNGFWVYVNTEVRSEPESGNVLDGWAECMYNVEESRARIEGREYGVLKRVTAPAGICTPEIVRTFHVRESEGRVYGRKDEYVQMMSDVFGIQEPDLFLEEWYGGEVLLYDFTLEAGDRYPCKGSVTVVAVDRVTTRDGVVRRLLRLSNGQDILEDIGCISSGSELLSYQNMGPGHRRTWDNPYAHGVYTYGGLMEYQQFENGNDEEGTLVYEKGDVKQSVSFLEEGKEWLYKSSAPSLADWSLRYQIQGDTVVGGHAGKKVYLTEERNGKSQEAVYGGALYEDGQKVYFVRPGSPALLLYDFSLQAGDKATVAAVSMWPETVGITIDDVRTVTVDGREQRAWQYSTDSRTAGYGGGWWIEGVGDFRLLLPSERMWDVSTLGVVTMDGQSVDALGALRSSLRGERQAYRPMLVDGRRWKYVYHHYEDGEDGTHAAKETTFNLEYYLDGDTLIGDVPYRKMYREQEDGSRSYDAAWCEEGMKVYKVEKGQTDAQVLFEFDLLPYEFARQPIENRTYFSHADTVAVDGVPYLRHHFAEAMRDQTASYVEGIGGVEGLWPFMLPRPTCLCDYAEFIGVYEDGRCIFSLSDLDKEKYTDGIQPVATPRHTNHDNGIYDLQGRRIQGNGVTGSQGNGQLPRGVYIQNGRKFVVR